MRLMIERVEARIVRVPLDNPTYLSTRRVDNREYAVVRVQADGVTGIGFCYAGHAGAGIVTQAVRELFAPMLIGRDASYVEANWADMYQEALLHGRAGSTMRALSALDVAMWDCKAKALGIPLHLLLGGQKGPTVPCYASGGYYLDGKSPKMLADEVSGYVEAGFKAVKIKVGRETPAIEEQRVLACREAIGPNVPLMLDANNAWSSVAQARQFTERWRDANPFWVEEPFSPDDVAMTRTLREESGLPIATGEIVAGRWAAAALMDANAVHYLQPDALVCGGITEYRRIAAVAETKGIPLCPHWFHDLHIHLVAALLSGLYVEFFPDEKVLNFRKLLDRQLEVIDGALSLPEDPGLGFEFDDRALDRLAIDAWN